MAYTVEKYTPLAPLLPREQLEVVVASFYDRVYAHPWLGRFFVGVDRRKQEFELVYFVQASWEDRAYPKRQARYLRAAHAHLFITDELFDLRQALLAEALRQHGHGDDVVEAFRDFDERWRAQVVKASRDECSSTLHEIVAIAPPSPGRVAVGEGSEEGPAA